MQKANVSRFPPRAEFPDAVSGLLLIFLEGEVSDCQIMTKHTSMSAGIFPEIIYILHCDWERQTHPKCAQLLPANGSDKNIQRLKHLSELIK